MIPAYITKNMSSCPLDGRVLVEMESGVIAVIRWEESMKCFYQCIGTSILVHNICKEIHLKDIKGWVRKIDINDVH